jgi:hypothetical protein
MAAMNKQKLEMPVKKSILTGPEAMALNKSTVTH